MSRPSELGDILKLKLGGDRVRAKRLSLRRQSLDLIQASMSVGAAAKTQGGRPPQ